MMKIIACFLIAQWGLNSLHSPSQSQSSEIKPSVMQTASSQAVFKSRGSEKASSTQEPIEFDGLQAFTKSEVLKILREQGIELPGVQQSNQEIINKVALALKDLLQSRGYMDASVVGYAVENSRPARLVVQEGTRYPVGSVLFEGTRSFASVDLSSKLREYLGEFSRETGSDYNREVFEYCLRRLTNLMRSRGYLQARFGDPRISVVGSGLSITVPIEEGRRYRLGDVKIEGAEALTSEELRLQFGVVKGEIANGEKISKWLFEDLKRIYGEKGYIQYTAEPIPVFTNDPRNPDEGIVDLSITVEEGKRFKLSSISFAGNPLPSQISDMVLLRAGDFYNDLLLDESIGRLNNSGLFEPIDRDKDLNFSTDEEVGAVALVIKVKKKGN